MIDRIITSQRSLIAELLLFGLVVTEVIVAQLVRVLVGGNDTQELTELLLLQELLGQVLDVALAESGWGLHGHGVGVVLDGDCEGVRK